MLLFFFFFNFINLDIAIFFVEFISFFSFKKYTMSNDGLSTTDSSQPAGSLKKSESDVDDNKMCCHCSIPFRDDDDEKERQRKRSIVLPFSLIAAAELCFGILWIFGNVLHPTTIAILIGGGVTASSLLYMYASRSAPLNLIEGTFVFQLIVVAMLDWSTASRGSQAHWPLAILVLDGLLTSGARAPVIKSSVVSLFIWLFVRASEDTFRWGLWDILPQDGETERGCPVPPSRIGIATALGDIVSSTIVFYLDFYMTQGFANGMRAEKEKMSQAVKLSNSIARSLALFDLVEAEKLLKKAIVIEGEESDLTEAFELLLSNLHKYEPYLPRALFEQKKKGKSPSISNAVIPFHDDHSGKDVTVLSNSGVYNPTAPSGTVAMVFTDVQSSTELWEASAYAMSEALQLHNAVIRSVISLHFGYEVKTIGDAFMIAFSTARFALRFCIEAQEQLVIQHWPSELLEVSSYQRLIEGNTQVWNGLRVRMGAHYGPVRVEENPIIKRTDYFGPTVNRAARVESVSVGGLIAVTTEFLAEILISEFEIVKQAPVSVDLKGIGITLIHGILPKSLSIRLVGIIEKGGGRKLTLDTMSHRSSKRSVIRGIRQDQVHTVGTVMHCRTGKNSSGDLVSELEFMQDTCDLSDGLIMGVLGSLIMICWNGVGNPCPAHTTHACRFGAKVSQAGRSSCGIVTGPLTHLTVGKTQKFVTSTGWCEELSNKLCTLAFENDTMILVSGVPEYPSSQQDPIVSAYLRPVGIWTVKGTNKTISICELHKSFVSVDRVCDDYYFMNKQTFFVTNNNNHHNNTVGLYR